MKKLFLTLLAILLITGIASAAGIPYYVDAKTGPEVWITSVYNNSGGTLDVGDVVVWDISSSTGDNDNYVTTTTTASTFLVAGVVYPLDIAAANEGTIAIMGPVAVDCASTVAAGERICSSGAAGEATDVQCHVGDAFGYALTASSSSSCMVNIFGKR